MIIASRQIETADATHSGSRLDLWRAVAIGIALVLVAATLTAATRPPGQPRLRVAGVAQDPMPAAAGAAGRGWPRTGRN